MEDYSFDKIKNSLLSLDPVTWCEKNLSLDGKPFRLKEAGYRPMIEIFRYMGVKILERDAKPMIWLKSRQTGGSTSATAIEMYLMGSGLFGNETSNPPIRIAHIWPRLDSAAGFSKTKLAAMIDSSTIVDDPRGKGKRPLLRTLLDTNSSVNDSLQFKQFQGGNHIWVESAGLDGSRMRGKTLDMLFYDEVQEIPVAAINNTNKTCTKAQYGQVGDGAQVYFGTPLQRGSNFWELWNNSSQQYFYLGCYACSKHFPLYTPGSNEWENIWLYANVVRCTHCHAEQDRMEAIDRGKWVAQKDPAEAKFVGFHLNQLYLPEFTKEKIIAAKPGNSVTNTERAYQNEVLGEFFQGEAAIVTPDLIRDKCGDPERRFKAGISIADPEIAFLGIDIGAKADLEQLVMSDRVKNQGQSYSTAIVLVIKGTQLSIEFATKFKRNDLESKKGIIDKLMRDYSVKLAVCDIGYANDFNEIMQTQYGERFLSSQASNHVNNKFKFNKEIFPKIIAFERDHWITDLYDQMKKGMVRFPLGNYEQISWLIQHCCNMEIKPSVSRTGEVNAHYIKSGPNDGFMGLLNAYLAYRFYLQHSGEFNPGGGKPEGKKVAAFYLPRSPR